MKFKKILGLTSSLAKVSTKFIHLSGFIWKCCWGLQRRKNWTGALTWESACHLPWAKLVPDTLPHRGCVLLLVSAVCQTRTPVLEATVYPKDAICPISWKLIQVFFLRSPRKWCVCLMLGSESRHQVNFLLLWFWVIFPSWWQLMLLACSGNPGDQEGLNAAHGVPICARFLHV